MKVTLRIFENESEFEKKTLGEGTHVLGRTDSCDIMLPDDTVSRKHLEIRVTESAVYASNLSSGGRVFLNNEPIETAEVTSGDQLSLGPYRIIVHVGTEVSAAKHNVLEDVSPAPNLELQNELEGGEAEIPQENFDPPQDDVFNGAVDNNFDAPQPAASYAPPAESFANEAFQGTAALNVMETQVEMKPLVAKLIFTTGPNKGEELFLETYEVTFGRSRKADIFLDDDKLSRIHAKVSRVGSGYRLIDMNSRNGTYVNGMRVLEHPLSSYDEIQIGKSKIKFLIHDVAGDLNKGGPKTQTNLKVVEQTKSLQLNTAQRAELQQLRQSAPPPLEPTFSPQQASSSDPIKNASPITKIVVVLGVALLAYYFLLEDEKKPSPISEGGAPTEVASPTPGTGDSVDGGADIVIAPSLPREYNNLSPAVQRQIEGHYRSALNSADRELYADAVQHLKRIHESLPYYKNSRELLEKYEKQIRAAEAAVAQDKARQADQQDIAIYLDEGLNYLKTSDFEKAAEAFNRAIVLDPNNEIAKKGLRAAQLKLRDLNDIPPEEDPRTEKKKQVAELFQKAVAAFLNKSYQEAIDIAESIRKIELEGDTQYLSEAKQIIDRARMQQKEEFEPFLIQAKEKYAEGDYNSARDLCEEMVKRDPAYQDAVDLLDKTKRQLNRLAKEAYVHGYILESMNKIEEAKTYWNRSKNYVRPGDPYFDKVQKKLEYYQ